MNKYTIAAASGAIVFGTAEIASPDVVMKILGVAPEDLNPAMKTLTRAFGARNLTLGAMMLTKHGRSAVLSALPVFLAGEAAALGLAFTQDKGKPMFPALGGLASTSVAVLLWKGSRAG